IIKININIIFIFKAEDGIRDRNVTGVQTCALPIWRIRKKKQPKKRSQREENYIRNAKFLLMERNHLSEEEAHRYIQKSSMDSGTNMVETAQMILMLMFEEG